MSKKEINKKKITIISILVLVAIIAVISNFLDKSLDGKKIAFFGDSLMAGYGNDDKGLDYYFKEYLPNSELVNYSRGGSTITSNTGDDDIVIINQIKSITGDPELILFDGGANDILGYGFGYLKNELKKEIGTIDMDINKVADSNTVMGDMEKLVVDLQNKFPSAKLCYIQLFLVNDGTIDKITINEGIKPELKQRREQFFSQTKALCKKRNIEYIDVSDKVDTANLSYRQEDWIHISDLGYKKLSPYIIDELEK